MGYFPNGTAGDLYRERYCSRCWHDRNDDCPIWTMHLVDNYRECNDKGSKLHQLIPRDKDGWNEQCRLFVERSQVHPSEKQP